MKLLFTHITAILPERLIGEALGKLEPVAMIAFFIGCGGDRVVSVTRTDWQLKDDANVICRTI